MSLPKGESEARPHLEGSRGGKASRMRSPTNAAVIDPPPELCAAADSAHLCGKSGGSDSTCGTSSPSPRLSLATTPMERANPASISSSSSATTAGSSRTHRRHPSGGGRDQSSSPTPATADSAAARAADSGEDRGFMGFDHFDEAPPGTRTGRELEHRKCRFKVFVVFRGAWCDTSRMLLTGECSYVGSSIS